MGYHTVNTFFIPPSACWYIFQGVLISNIIREYVGGEGIVVTVRIVLVGQLVQVFVEVTDTDGNVKAFRI